VSGSRAARLTRARSTRRRTVQPSKRGLLGPALGRDAAVERQRDLFQRWPATERGRRHPLVELRRGAGADRHREVDQPPPPELRALVRVAPAFLPATRPGQRRYGRHEQHHSPTGVLARGGTIAQRGQLSGGRSSAGSEPHDDAHVDRRQPAQRTVDHLLSTGPGVPSGTRRSVFDGGHRRVARRSGFDQYTNGAPVPATARAGGQSLVCPAPAMVRSELPLGRGGGDRANAKGGYREGSAERSGVAQSWGASPSLPALQAPRWNEIDRLERSIVSSRKDQKELLAFSSELDPGLPAAVSRRYTAGIRAAG
jgi:hypothetical protein